MFNARPSLDLIEEHSICIVEIAMASTILLRSYRNRTVALNLMPCVLGKDARTKLF